MSLRKTSGLPQNFEVFILLATFVVARNLGDASVLLNYSMIFSEPALVNSVKFQPIYQCLRSRKVQVTNHIARKENSADNASSKVFENERTNV